jgi:hypothetical protein
MLFNAVNLLWQKRFRGAAPVAQHATADSGVTLLIRPDEFERRTYQVLQLDPEGDVRELFAVLVETVYRFDATPDGRLLLGMTDDDIYVFREARKARFMAERRVAYSDISLAPETGWFACAFSDHLFSTHSVAFGDANGRLGWTKDLDRPIQRVGLSLEGRVLAVAFQDGSLQAIDNMRNPVWSSGLDEPIAALALPVAGLGAVAATAHGSVAAIGPDGALRWRSPVGPPALAVAVDREGRWTASVHSDEGTHLLVVLGPGGAPVWEYELEAKPTGVSLSPNGRFLCVTHTQGAALCFEADFTAPVTAPGADLGGGESLEALRAQSAARPHDIALAERWLAARAARVGELRAAAEAHADAGDFAAALGALTEAAAADPWNPELFAARLALHGRAADALAAQAAAHEAAYDLESAVACSRSLLELRPEDAAQRATLGRLRGLQAAELRDEGERRHAEGDLAGALKLWRQAQDLAPDDDLAARIRGGETERCLARGIELYEAQRLAEAAFQFKKALALDPGNETAERYLGYTEGRSADSTIADRFARLE